MSAGIVIVGGGQAGVQAADSIRSADADVPITIVADEVQHPYQRPPISKSLWSEDISAAAVPLRSVEFFADRAIRLLSGVHATRIDRDAKLVECHSGDAIPYDALVIATGARPRSIPLPGIDLPGVHQLRTLDDGMALQKDLRTAESLVVIGGGFVGLEVAASAPDNNVHVSVLEAQNRILERSVTPATSRWLADFHRGIGVDLRLDATAHSIVGTNRVTAVEACGERLPTDLVVIGVGAVPNTALAAQSGLDVDNGVVVDATLRTADPSIWSIGDCVRFPSHHTGETARLESVQNATDQARVVAKNIVATLGAGDIRHPYVAVPWFWSNQGSVRLQIAGIGTTATADTVVRRYADDQFSVFVYDGDRLVVVESVNVPGDHIAARRIISAGGQLDRDTAADPEIPLKSIVRLAAS